ncbi:diaminopimelate decarboxylase [Rhodococcus sp. NPDC058505]|uniref:diaminopimelate decarboxylase n=1 Tax=Rhodococcus sp. NPDC058505 TaxID=3346531 RepID=UPI00365C57E1
MTLLDILPSLRSAMTPRLDPDLWPVTTHVDELGRITVGGVALCDVADQFGTPTYLLDERDVRYRCRVYRDTFPEAEIAYAGKALLTRAVAAWIADEGLSLDVCSAGELAIALSAGVDPRRIILHGNVKTSADLTAARSARVGRIVVDSPTEITMLSASSAPRQNVLVRVTPGVDAGTHRAVTTGIDDQKFGFPLAHDQAVDAIRRILGQPRLNLIGLHCHLGSQIVDTECYGVALDRLIATMAQVRLDHGTILTQLNLGGGHGVSYRAGDPALDPSALAETIEDVLDDACARHRFPRPRIVLEPGRAITARAGVTVYRVVSVKQVRGGRTFVCVDGGMSDNPRVALYGARYTVALANRHSTAPTTPVTVAGRYCESGDEIAVDTSLPGDVRPGDVLAVPVTGAYHHSLASTYNAVGRPPVVAAAAGAVRELVRRETIADLLGRDVGR